MSVDEPKTLFERLIHREESKTIGRLCENPDGQPGATLETAIEIASISQEYAFMAISRLTPIDQRYLVSNGRHYDVFRTKGTLTEVWFDVTSFRGV